MGDDILKIIAHCSLGQTYKRVQNQVNTIYENELQRRSVAVVKKLLADKNTKLTTDVIGQAIWEELGEDLADDQVFIEMTDLVVDMTDNPNVKRELFEKVDKMPVIGEEGIMYPTTRQLAKAAHAFSTFGEQLLRDHLIPSVWHKFLGHKLTPLQVLMTDRESIAHLCFPLKANCGSRKRHVEMLFAAAMRVTMNLDNASWCRSCGNESRKSGAHKIKCNRCKRIYFCSEKCRVLDGCDKMSGHATRECEILEMEKNTEIPK